MNHWDSFHWRSYHFASNHFWGTGTPVAPAVGQGAPFLDMLDVEKQMRRVENNQRAALLVAIAEADEL